MEKNAINHWFNQPNGNFYKLLLTMKLSTLLLMTCMLNALAGTTYSQSGKVSLNLKNVRVEDVLNEIEKSSNYYFLFNQRLVDVNRKVDVSVDNAPIKDVLAGLFKEENVDFVVLDRQIILAQREKNSAMAALVQQKISGTVTDAISGEALIGVSIAVEGTTMGTVTDVSGKYSIDVPNANSTLVFTYVGYVSQKLTAAALAIGDVKMSPDIKNLDEVVVIGYGVQKKKLFTGATVQVKSEDIANNHVSRIESALQGLTPGMVIVQQSGQPGADFNITIRGLSSPNGNAPLVLIDGVPGSFSTLNPSDVESVDVLKDAASAAIYGARAANGVVLVTTKKGKTGEPQISYDFSYGVSNAYRKIPMLNAKEYAIIMNEEAANSGSSPFFSQAYINSLGKGTDWQQEAYNKDAPKQNHYLNISGGTDKSKYSLSLSYAGEEGIYDLENKSKYERFGFRVNTETAIRSYLKIGENLSYSHRTSHGLGVTNIYNNFVRTILQGSPLIQANDASVYDGYGRSSFNLDQINPIASMHYNYNSVYKNDDLVGDIFVELQIFKGLKFRSDYGGALNFNYNTDAVDTFKLTPSTYNSVAYYTQGTGRTFASNFDNSLSYEKILGKHSVAALVGMNARDNWFFKQSTTVNGALTNSTPVLSNVVPDTTKATGDFGKGESGYSYFARLSYNYDEKYMATFSYRSDGSSRFGSSHRIGGFPSASVGWVISREKFFEPLSASVSLLKLRVSYGANGKTPSADYQYLATVAKDNRYYSFGGSKEVGISPNIMANADLKWESSKQFNAGIDAKFLTNFNFAFDYYKKTSSDWIVPKTVAGYTGIAGISTTNPLYNNGNVINEGVEFELGFVKRIGELTLDLRGNMSYNHNKVTQVPGKILHGHASILFNGVSEISRVQEGFPMGYFWGLKTAGIFQSDADVSAYTNNGKVVQSTAKAGDVKFVDLNSDGVIDDNDKTQIGDPSPKCVFGLNIGASYKGFDFAMNLAAQTGFQIVQSYREESNAYGNYTTAILDRWTGPGTSNKIPRVTLGDEANGNWRRFSDLYIHNGDFLRVKSVNLGYDLKRVLLKNLPVQQLRFFVSATNLLTLTKYTGSDPEVGYGDSQDPFSSGIDLGFYPTARSYMFGFNVKF